MMNGHAYSSQPHLINGHKEPIKQNGSEMNGDCNDKEKGFENILEPKPNVSLGFADYSQSQ